jgi:tRNA(Ile)-lysidine synthase
LVAEKLAGHGIPRIVLGLSGGPDSVFLLYVLYELKKQKKIDLVATHLDHQWRAESWQDVEFCKKLCRTLDVEFISYKADELGVAFKSNGSKEELGRKMRRFLFDKVLSDTGSQFICLAHHLQDQQETFFLRLLRGASLSGLCCMREFDGKYLRPLLNVNKKEIIEYLDLSFHSELDSVSGANYSNFPKYLIDSTNTSQDYLRNRIRSNVLPALESVDSRFGDKFKTTVKLLQQEDDFLNLLAVQAFNDIFTFDSKVNHWVGNLLKFKQLQVVHARRLILYWLIQEKCAFNVSTNFLDEIIDFLCSPRGGSHQVGASWSVFKKQKSFWIH